MFTQAVSIHENLFPLSRVIQVEELMYFYGENYLHKYSIYLFLVAISADIDRI